MKDLPDPTAEVRRLYDEAESRVGRAMEDLVGRDSFGVLLVRMTENVLGVMKIGADAADLAVRNLRLAGRRDVIALARQLGRTEDKLEAVLQEVELLREELATREQNREQATTPPATARSRTRPKAEP